MTSDLQPMSIGDTFDTAFDLYKHNFALFAGITALIQVPAQLAFAALYLSLDMDELNRPTNTSADVGAVFVAFGVMLVMVAVYHFLYVIHGAALSVAVSERLLGRHISIREAYRRIRPHLVKLIVTWIVIDLILFALTFVLFIATSILAVFAMGAAAMAAGTGGEPGLVVSIIAVILMVVLPFLAFIAMAISFAVFSTQIVVLEGTGYFNTLSRNWSLLAGKFWQPFWSAVILVLLVFSLQIAIELSLQYLVGLALYSWLNLSHIAQQVVEEGLSTLVSLFLHPFIMISLTILYFNQRIRKEGFDIDLALFERQTARPDGTPRLSEGSA